MSRPTGPEHDPALEFALRGETTPGWSGPTSPCPHPDLLLAYGEGRALAEERALVEPHVATCHECMDLVAGLAREAPAADSARRTWPRFLAYAAAAGVLLAVGAFAYGRLSSSPPAGTDEALVAAARDLASFDPALFEGLRPLDRAERLASAATLQRGGVVLLHPSGRVAETRPTFRWEPASGVRTWSVTLSAADGVPLWTATSPGPTLAYPADRPALSPGSRYLWEVAGAGPLGSLDSSRAFEVMGEDDRRRYEAAQHSLAARVPAPLRYLLSAHLALRWDAYAEAEPAAREWLASRPDDVVGRETLDRARRLLGAPPAVPHDPRASDR